MADPHHVEVLSGFDRMTVGLYRLGLCVGAIGVGAVAWAHAAGFDDGFARWGCVLSVGLIATNLHLYDRLIRWVVGAAAWTGVVAIGAAPVGPAALAPWVADAGLGFLFVVFSAAALKERYCFRLPIVVLVPPVLAGALIPLRLGAGPATAALLAVGAGVLGLLAVSKLRMPLHYDIGDKSRYQV